MPEKRLERTREAYREWPDELLWSEYLTPAVKVLRAERDRRIIELMAVNGERRCQRAWCENSESMN